MSIITLLTDFGYKDHYVGVLKGKLMSKIDNINIIDISHEVSKYNTFEANYLTSNYYHHFPKYTIHYICIDTEVGVGDRLLMILADEHYFFCADNGSLTDILKNSTDIEVYELDFQNNYLDTFIQATLKVLSFEPLISIGKPITEYTLLHFNYQDIYEENKIKGTIIYVDSFGNLVTNITKDLFLKHYKERSFRITKLRLQSKKVYNNFADYKTDNKRKNIDLEGDIIPIFNEAGNFEIGMYKSDPKRTGSAKSLLGVAIGDTFVIEFN